MTGRQGHTLEFSYTVENVAYEIGEEPVFVGPTVPLELFSQGSTLQVLTRYLVDEHGITFSEAAKLLRRSMKTVWASYHQRGPLASFADTSLPIPIGIFAEELPPLEALVSFLRKQGLRNIDIAKALDLSPKTTHTAHRRAEERR